jgi:hypothetical protein
VEAGLPAGVVTSVEAAAAVACHDAMVRGRQPVGRGRLESPGSRQLGLLFPFSPLSGHATRAGITGPPRPRPRPDENSPDENSPDENSPDDGSVAVAVRLKELMSEENPSIKSIRRLLGFAQLICL